MSIRFLKMKENNSSRKKELKIYKFKKKPGISYSLDYKAFNICKLFKSIEECKRTCMAPAILIDNLDRGW